MTTIERMEGLADDLCAKALRHGLCSTPETGKQVKLADAALMAAIRELVSDAERYRWLRSHVEDYDGHATFPSVPYPCPIPDKSPFNAIDDAIDAAREQEGKI